MIPNFREKILAWKSSPPRTPKKVIIDEQVNFYLNAVFALLKKMWGFWLLLLLFKGNISERNPCLLRQRQRLLSITILCQLLMRFGKFWLYWTGDPFHINCLSQFRLDTVWSLFPVDYVSCPICI